MYIKTEYEIIDKNRFDKLVKEIGDELYDMREKYDRDFAWEDAEVKVLMDYQDDETLFKIVGQYVDGYTPEGEAPETTNHVFEHEVLELPFKNVSDGPVQKPTRFC